jgi:hypothetical protein
LVTPKVGAKYELLFNKPVAAFFPGTSILDAKLKTLASVFSWVVSNEGKKSFIPLTQQAGQERRKTFGSGSTPKPYFS